MHSGTGITAIRFVTTGGSEMTFFSTQFTPVEEAERFRDVLLALPGGPHRFTRGSFTGEPIATTFRSRVEPTQPRWYEPETTLLLEVS